MLALFQLKNKIKSLFSNETGDDINRKYFILKTLCLSSIIFLFILLILSFYSLYVNIYKEFFSSIFIIMLFIIINLFSLHLNKRNKYLYGSALILISIYSCILYGSFRWGADLPTVLISLFIIVLMSGVLINSKFGLISALLLSIHLCIFNYIEDVNIITTNHHWKLDSFNRLDVIEYSALLIFAALFSWLSNNQSEKALIRSRKAEKELQLERDSLEINVKKRTEEIRELQIEKINSMYRMVEFGRISSGLFHDIISPLTNIALNLKTLKIEEAQESVRHLIPSITKIESIIQQSKKQMKIDKTFSLFSIEEEVSSIIEILKSKTIKSGIKIKLFIKNDVGGEIYGSPTLFSHIIMNLLSNAIDSYKQEIVDVSFLGKNKVVTVKIKIMGEKIFIKITDNGQGIDDNILDKIFEPFYTTKQDHGCGIGLSSTKHILEKYFNGEIFVKSKVAKGTSFTVIIPRAVSPLV